MKVQGRSRGQTDKARLNQFSQNLDVFMDLDRFRALKSLGTGLEITMVWINIVSSTF